MADVPLSMLSIHNEARKRRTPLSIVTRRTDHAPTTPASPPIRTVTMLAIPKRVAGFNLKEGADIYFGSGGLVSGYGQRRSRRANPPASFSAMRSLPASSIRLASLADSLAAI